MDKSCGALAMSERAPDSGFTLVEVLTALSVFSIAGLAIINLISETTAGAGHVDARFLAELEASNQMAETFVQADPLVPGILSGENTQRGRTLVWTRTIIPTERQNLLSVEVTVADPETGQVLSRLQALKEAGNAP